MNIEIVKGIKVSCFKDVHDTKPKQVSLLKWLKGYSKLNHLVDDIRKAPDKASRDELKKKMPAITPSGLFEERNTGGLIKHSGFIGLDFDNICPDRAKNILKGIDNVFYAGLSASGQGVWALIPISYPEHHKRHFEALEADFKSLGLEIDKACKDICRLRFYSYDNAPVFNINAIIYRKFAREKTYQPVLSRKCHDNNLEKLVNKIESTQSDITVEYIDWLKIAGALASVYGEAGRQIFHRISRFHYKYSPRETDRQYSACLRNKPGFNVAMIFAIASKYNI